MAYAQNDDMLLLKGTMFISGTKLNMMSYIYDCITQVLAIWNDVPAISQYKSIMFGMKAIHHVGDLARKVTDALVCW